MNVFSTAMQRTLLKKVIIGLICALMAIQAVSFQNPSLVGRDADVTDLSAYYVTGKLVNEGRASDAYHWPTVMQEQARRFGHVEFMPWAYPPQVTLATGMLGLLPISLAYLFFAGLSFWAFLTVLKRVAGPWSTAALVVVLPALFVNARCGQSGFLIASIMGCVLLWLGSEHRRAGLALGAMLFKPHLGIALGLMALLARRWTTLAVAFGVVVVTSVIVGIVLGWPIWEAYLRATATAGEYLRAGFYPLARMTSAYAAARGAGLGASTAFALQAICAVFVLGALALAVRAGMARHRLQALAIVASLLVSPYNYDYDMVALALAVGLIAPDILARCSTAEAFGLTALTWLATANVPILRIQVEMARSAGISEADGHFRSFSFFALAILLAWCVAILRRHPQTDSLVAQA